MLFLLNSFLSNFPGLEFAASVDDDDVLGDLDLLGGVHVDHDAPPVPGVDGTADSPSFPSLLLLPGDLLEDDHGAASPFLGSGSLEDDTVDDIHNPFLSISEDDAK